MSNLAVALDRANRHAQRMSAFLDIPEWRPGRAHIEQMRNTINALIVGFRKEPLVLQPTRELLMETLHRARWPADRQVAITPFAEADANEREYVGRLADAVLALLKGETVQPSNPKEQST